MSTDRDELIDKLAVGLDVPRELIDDARARDEWRREYATDPSLWTDMSTDPFEAGRAAAQLDMTIAECPFGPTEPDERGLMWRQGWIEGEATKREQAGTFDHTRDEYVAAQRMVGIDPECGCGYCVEARARLPRDVEQLVASFTLIGAQFSATFTGLAAAVQTIVGTVSMACDNAMRQLNLVLSNVDVDGIEKLLGIVAEEQPTDRRAVARDREQALLRERRRSHRRTNRWGPPPGRRR